MGVAEVEADADALKMADFEDFHQVLRCGWVADEIFGNQADAERLGKGVEVLEGGDGVVLGAGGPGVGAFAEVNDEVLKVQVLGGFESAFDLVHGVDAARLFRVQQVDGGGAGAAHLAIGGRAVRAWTSIGAGWRRNQEASSWTCSRLV